MNKKLALQQLIEWISQKVMEGYPPTPSDITAKSRELLSVEKEEIIEAYYSGTAQFANDAMIDYPQKAQDYIEKTFEQ